MSKAQKDATAADVHISTTGGRRRKPPAAPMTNKDDDDDVGKGNPWHDALGRFASGGGHVLAGENHAPSAPGRNAMNPFFDASIKGKTDSLASKLSSVDFDRGPTKSVDLASLVSGQPDYNSRKVDRIAQDFDLKDMPPLYVLRDGGRDVLMEGNHRALAALRAGHKSLPAKVLDMAATKNVSKAARALKPNHEDEGATALSPFPYDPNALSHVRPDQTPRFFGALTDADKLPNKKFKLSDLTAMQNRVDPKKVEAMRNTEAKPLKPPVVVSMAGRHYIADGHHRATRAWLDGEKEIDVKHKDLEPVSNALKADDTKSVVVVVRGDEGEVAKLLNHIGKTAAVGHSFSVVVDPGDKDYEAKFGFDGDGAFRIVSVKETAAARTEKAAAAPAGGDAGWAIPFAIAKADPEQRLIFGWASVVEEGGHLIIDKQGDAILPEDLEKAAYDFVLYARQHGEMHKTIGTGRLVESMVFTADKQAALGISLGKVGWWAGFKIDDDATWQAHKEGKLPEFSIGGSGRREQIT